MKIKKITAPTMAEAMNLVKEQLGNDAIILNSKVIETGGFLGLFKKKNIEVIAALDEQMPQVASAVEAPVAKPIVIPTPPKPVVPQTVEMKAVKQEPQFLVEIKNALRAQEIQEEIVEKLLHNVEHFHLENEEDVQDLLRHNMLPLLRDLDFGGISFTKKYINIVGPTGVGKTTTLAKIAAHCVLKHKKKVAFITTDTYRIAAIDQLKTYAQILSVPLEVCYNMTDFKAAQEKFKEYDIVFIDTAGRNFTKSEYVMDLKNTIDFHNDVETFLVLALTSKYSDMKKIFQQFSIIPIHRFIFTKLDETGSYGAMLNLMFHHKLGIAYITNGQNVPDDLVEIGVEEVTKTIIEGYVNERSS